LIKFAYHPNWQVTGAKHIYHVSPGFMLVIPEQNNVRLFYGKKPYNYLAYACGILGILLLFSYGHIEKYILSLLNRRGKRDKNISLMFKRITKKIQAERIKTFFSDNKASIIFIIVLVVVVAYMYSNTMLFPSGK
jgi:hypothetical protein